MLDLSKISSTADSGLERRLPPAFEGLDLNFCRNPTCASYGVPPDPFKRPNGAPPAPPGVLRGEVSGAKHAEFFQCPTCNKTARIKNNRAVWEEYQRLKRLQEFDPTVPSCRSKDCFAHGMSPDEHPEFYRRYGRTANGDPRFQCGLCKKTFSIGKPARRHLRSDKNRVIFKMLCNDVSLSKICKITDTSYRDLYGKIDFFHDQIQAFIAQREDFGRVDFGEVGSRFATDSQTLMLNWPTKRKRTPVAVQHLCTAHHRSGYIMEAAFQFDPSMTMEQAEAQSLAADEDDVSVAFRQHARVWTQSEFDQYLFKLRKQKKIPDTELYQLPHDGALVRYDVLQCAHALRVREMLSGTDVPLLLMMDDDKGLQLAFHAAFVDEIQERRADLAVVSFDKGMTNDARNQVVAAGQSLLAGLTGTPISAIRELPNEDYAQLVDFASYMLVAGWPMDKGKRFAFSRKSEPNKVVRIPTWRQGQSPMSAARLLRRATLRSVDSYFHKFRSNVRFAARPAISAGSTGHVWDKHYLYKPGMMGNPPRF
ncbi:transposase [Primorskyibacter sp. 2E107]|uniref:transposase n=1 Tax=Primorskyibacter sp. 2E107 TaxID=3403458 RepID=UPI003AF88CF3